MTVPCGVQGRPGAISDLAPAFSGGGGYRLPRQALPKPSGSTRNPGRRYGPVLTTVPPVMHAATRRATCHPCTANPVLVPGPSAMAWWPCRVPRIKPPPGSVGAAWRAVSTRYRLGHTLQCSLAGVLETPARYWRYGGCRLCIGTRLLPWISSPRRSLMAGHTACPNPSTCTGRPGTKRHGPPGATSAPRRRTMPEVFRAGTTPVYRRCRVACRVSQELSLASACDSWAARGIDPQAKLCPLCPRPAMGSVSTFRCTSSKRHRPHRRGQSGTPLQQLSPAVRRFGMFPDRLSWLFFIPDPPPNIWCRSECRVGPLLARSSILQVSDGGSTPVPGLARPPPVGGRGIGLPPLRRATAGAVMGRLVPPPRRTHRPPVTAWLVGGGPCASSSTASRWPDPMTPGPAGNGSTLPSIFPPYQEVCGRRRTMAGSASGYTRGGVARSPGCCEHH